MHIEKNVAESLIGTLLDIPGKTKDGIKSRQDLQEMKIRKGLHPTEVGEKNSNCLMLLSHYGKKKSTSFVVV
jgi:hypothetical protein